MITHRTPGGPAAIERLYSNVALAVVAIASMVAVCSCNACDGKTVDQTIVPSSVGRACFSNDECDGDAICVNLMCSVSLSSDEGRPCDTDLPCADGLECSQHVCCSSEHTVCGTKCVDTDTDSKHCGGCGESCPFDQFCVYGTCREICKGADCIAQGSSFFRLAAGGYHTCGILHGWNRVVCWGLNNDGQAPPGPSADSFLSVSAGDYHTCGVRETDNKVLCWGKNDDGQAPRTPSSEPLSNVTAGGFHTCAIREDQTVMCWGRNSEGQAPAQANEETYVNLSAGGSHTCGITEDQRVVCWGRNTKGQATPPKDGEFTSIGAGFDHTCAAGDDGLVCWGSMKLKKTPMAPLDSTGFSRVESGDKSACASVSSSGDVSVECFGKMRTPEPNFLDDIAVGNEHACGILQSPDPPLLQVCCWGRNDEGQAPVCPF